MASLSDLDPTFDHLDKPYEELLEILGYRDDSDLAMKRAAKVSKNKNENMDGILLEKEWLSPRNRKPLVKNRLVNFLDSCLDKHLGYYILPNELKEYTSILEKPKSKSDVGNSVT